MYDIYQGLTLFSLLLKKKFVRIDFQNMDRTQIEFIVFILVMTMKLLIELGTGGLFFYSLYVNPTNDPFYQVFIYANVGILGILGYFQMHSIVFITQTPNNSSVFDSKSNLNKTKKGSKKVTIIQDQKTEIII